MSARQRGLADAKWAKQQRQRKSGSSNFAGIPFIVPQSDFVRCCMHGNCVAEAVLRRHIRVVAPIVSGPGLGPGAGSALLVLSVGWRGTTSASRNRLFKLTG